MDRREGYIKGWVRRFYQGSTDHRGVPGSPGRVVTLLASEGARCHGIAYRLEGEEAERIAAALDVREQGGYVRVREKFYTTTGGAEEVLPDVTVYIASEDNSEYLGERPMEEMAAQIVSSRGPSGSNVEYVLKLAEALREMSVEDPHVFELEACVRALSAGDH